VWKFQNGEHGIWVGTLTDEEANSDRYGLWTIGDKQPENSPGYATKLQYKTWFGHPDRYAMGHHAPAGPPDGPREFVMVMNGWFCCEFLDVKCSLSYPACLDLPSDVARTWSLLDKSIVASGFTIRRQAGSPIIAGAGNDYELHVLDARVSDYAPGFLSAPDQNNNWNFQYIEVFQGRLALFLGDQQWPTATLSSRDHMFLSMQHYQNIVRFSCADVRGVVLYF
jgi:hypothetical protein